LHYAGTPSIYPLSLHDALPIFPLGVTWRSIGMSNVVLTPRETGWNDFCLASARSLSRSRLASTAIFLAPSSVTQPWNCIRCSLQIGRHTSELQSRGHLVCRLLL